MAETTTAAPVERSVPRLVVALAVAATMWVAAAFAVGTALVAPMMAFDDGRRRTESIVVVALASIAAVALFFGSGPASLVPEVAPTATSGASDRVRERAAPRCRRYGRGMADVTIYHNPN